MHQVTFEYIEKFQNIYFLKNFLNFLENFKKSASVCVKNILHVRISHMLHLNFYLNTKWFTDFLSLRSETKPSAPIF